MTSVGFIKSFSLPLFAFAVNPGQWQHGNFSGANESRVCQAPKQQQFTYQEESAARVTVLLLDRFGPLDSQVTVVFSDC